jgi:predicted metal-dependent phosphoesterase TrpH
MKFDLHSHSHHSDGSLSPQDLISLAANCEIDYLALTDHDTVKGLPEAHLAAADQNIKIINGLELSSSWNGQLLHIVGLGVDPENSVLVDGIQQNLQRRELRAEQMHEDFLKSGIDLTEEVAGLLKGAVPTRPHFAQALVNLGYAKDKRQAFKRYLVRGKPGYIALEWASLEEVGHWISAAGGVAVLAHPLRYKFTRTKLVRLIAEMKSVGIQGIEVSTCSTDPQQVTMLAGLAVEHKLLASIGSDFHSPDQPWAWLGRAQALPDHLEPVWSALSLH